MGNCLCVSELLNVLAANGEQGELGSDWCSGSWVLRVFRGCSIQGCAVHVLGGFCGREWCFEEGFGAGFWGVFGGGAILKNRGLVLWGIVVIFA